MVHTNCLAHEHIPPYQIKIHITNDAIKMLSGTYMIIIQFPTNVSIPLAIYMHFLMDLWIFLKAKMIM